MRRRGLPRAEGDTLVVGRARRHGSEAIHRALFGDRPPTRRSLDTLDEGIRARTRRRHAHG